jgi:hypothetical protein
MDRIYVAQDRVVNLQNRNSSVGIVTVCGLDYRGVGVLVVVGSRIFSSPRSPESCLWDTKASGRIE